MPTISSDARFLGVDLHAVWRDTRKALQGVHQSPLLSWLTPAVPVRLLQENGADSLWLDGAQVSGSTVKPGSVRCVALELPEALVLRRALVLPSMAAQDIASAVALEAQSVSPFGAGNVIWGYSVKPTAGGALALEVALASKKQAKQYIDTQSARLGKADDPEIWARSANTGAPIVFIGFGEAQRSKQAARWRHLGYGLLLTIVLLCLAIAITPTAQLRLRAIEAVRAYESITARAAPAVREREELLQSAEKLSALAEVLGGRIEPLTLMDRLTQVLPDDTALQTVRLQAGKVTILGLTGNASALMQLLSEQPGLREVRAPSAATRMPGAPKESFVIEFVLDPQQFGVQSAALQSTAPAPPSPVASALPAVGAASTDGSLGAGASAAASVPAKAPVAPPSPGAATFGGGATFGGVATRPAAPKSPAPATAGAASAAAPAKP